MAAGTAGQERPVLLQLRVTVPPDRADAVRELFEQCPGVAHLAVLPGASLAPPGDLVLADVAREAADGLVDGLRELGVDRDGGICMEAVDAAVSRNAEAAEASVQKTLRQRAPGAVPRVERVGRARVRT